MKVFVAFVLAAICGSSVTGNPQVLPLGLASGVVPGLLPNLLNGVGNVVAGLTGNGFTNGLGLLPSVTSGLPLGFPPGFPQGPIFVPQPIAINDATTQLSLTIDIGITSQNCGYYFVKPNQSFLTVGPFAYYFNSKLIYVHISSSNTYTVLFVNGKLFTGITGGINIAFDSTTNSVFYVCSTGQTSSYITDYLGFRLATSTGSIFAVSVVTATF